MRYKAKSLVTFIFLLLLIKSVFSEEKRPFKPRFSIKVTGGLGYVKIGDLNRCLESLNEEYRQGEYSPGDSINSRTGELEKLDNFTSDWEAELRIDINPKFTLGIGTSGYIYRKNESSIHITRQILYPLIEDFTFEDSITIKPEVKAWMPVKVGIYYGFLRSSRINLFLTGGIGCYCADISEYKVVEETGTGFFKFFSCNWSYWKIDHKAGLSLNGGLALEYNLTKNLALVVEAQARYAKINNLKGTTQFWDDEQRFFEQSGILYYFKWSILGQSEIKPYYDLGILDEGEDYMPDQYRGEVRKAVLDLSGFSLRMGVRINLF